MMTQEKLSPKELTFLSGLTLLLAGTYLSTSLIGVAHILIAIGAALQWKTFQLRETSQSWRVLALLCLALFVGLLANFEYLERPVKDLGKLKYFFIPLISYFPLKAIIERHGIQVLKIPLLTLIASCAIASLAGLVKMGTLFDFSQMRFPQAITPRNGGFTGIMRFSYGLALILPAALHILPAKKGWAHLAWAISAVGLLTAMSRGAWIGFAAGLLAFAFYKHRRYFWIALGMSTIIGTSILVLNMRATEESAGRLIMPLNSQTNTMRLSMYQAGAYTLIENPVFGVGFLQLPKHVKEIKAKYKLDHPDFISHSHNVFLEFFGGGGLIGGLLFLYFLFSWWARAGLYNELQKTWIITLCTGGLFEFMLDASTLTLTMFCFILAEAIKHRPEVPTCSQQPKRVAHG